MSQSTPPIDIIPPEKPLDEINRLLDVFINASTDYVADKKKNTVSFCDENGSPQTFLLLEGRIDVWQYLDNRLAETGWAPNIIGLQGSNYRSKMFYAQFPASSVVKHLPQQTALSLVGQHNLWKELWITQGYLIDRKLHRDLILMNSSAYKIICLLLHELEQYSEDERAQLSMADFIITRSRLARSGVMKIISELRAGGYIEVKNGKLIRIVKKLPKNY